MSDRYQRFANSGLGKRFARGVGLPTPTPLERHEPGKPVVSGPVLLGGAHGGRLAEPARAVLDSIGAEVLSEPPAGGEDGGGLAAIVFDASGIDESRRLRALYDFIGPVVRSLRPSGRLLILGSPPEQCESPREATAQRALEGFMRSMGKEVGKGATAQLVQVAPGGEGAIESTLRFLLSARSAYVSGQVVRVSALDGGAAAAAELGAAARRAASPPSPAPPAGSARRSPPCWPATAPRWSAPTCPPRARR